MTVFPVARLDDDLFWSKAGYDKTKFEGAGCERGLAPSYSPPRSILISLSIPTVQPYTPNT